MNGQHLHQLYAHSRNVQKFFFPGGNNTKMPRTFLISASFDNSLLQANQQQ